MRGENVRSGRLVLSAITKVVALALLVEGCGSTNVVMTTATTPMCTVDALAEWTRVVGRMQGVKGEDPVGYYIADFPAERFGSVINNWYPNSGYKETLCGELHHFNVYDGSGAEMDWNNFVIPASEFEYLITDVLPYKGGSGLWCIDDDWQSCNGENDCMEAEITPDESFYENPWFPKSTGSSVLEGRQICMYGPWIRECVHGHRPEIHPAELTWWKEPWQGADLYWLMALQDDSNRFDTEDDFDIESSIPAGWREWGAAPMTARFKLAFAVPPGGPVVEFGIGEAFARNVVTSLDSGARADADDAAAHAIQYNGQIVLRANENQPNDADLGVTFTDVCRRTDATLQGYVAVTTKTGVNNDGQEGYHVLYVTRQEVGRTVPPVVAPEAASEFILRTVGDPSSLRPTEVGTHRILVGDLKVEVTAPTGRAPKDLYVQSVELRKGPSNIELEYERDQAQTGGTVRNLPLLEPAELSVELSTNARMDVAWPGLALSGLIEDTVGTDSPAEAGTWQKVVSASGGLPTAPLPGLDVMRANEERLRVIPQYATRKNGRAALEEGSPFVERLNSVLSRGQEDEQREVFGTPAPITVEWAFEAYNLVDGNTVPVTRFESAAAPAKPHAGVEVVQISGSIPNDTLKVMFSDRPEAIIELRATATVTDVFGLTSKTQHRVFSHFIVGATSADIVEQLIPAVAAAAGASPDLLAAASKPGPLPQGDPRLRDPQFRQALLFMTVSLQAAEDGRITVDELQGLIRGASHLTGAGKPGE